MKAENPVEPPTSSIVANFNTMLRILEPYISPQVVKFILTGGVNTLFNYSVYASLVFIGLNYQLALILSNIAGIIFNYFTFSYLVFNHPGGLKVFSKFLPVYGVVYVSNASLLEFLTSYVGLNPYLSQVICIPVAATISYLGMSRWVYKRQKNPTETESTR